MKILAIETSCDETAIAIVEAEGSEKNAQFRILGNALLSQIEAHKEYGGVFPALAKREHAKNLVPVLEAALEEAELLHESVQTIPDDVRSEIIRTLEREAGLAGQFLEFVSECEPPNIDAVAVTAGPGLEPALWVGINFAKALALLWQKPLIAVNHMEGHIMAALARNKGDAFDIDDVQTPVLALLISGGHTELVLMDKWLEYKLIGQTRDDAVGEAFDKVARMLELPYPGGPEISRLAEMHRANSDPRRLRAVSERVEDPNGAIDITLPRPMIDSLTCDFSFAGLKTAVLYLLKKNSHITEHKKERIAHEFENAVADVLWKKTAQALIETNARVLVIGGGVSANTHIRRVFTENMGREFPHIELRIPAAALTTDNAIMISIAAYCRAQRKEFVSDITANGNLSLA